MLELQPLAQLGILSQGTAFVPSTVTRQLLSLMQYISKNQPKVARDLLKLKIRPANAQANILLAAQVQSCSCSSFFACHGWYSCRCAIGITPATIIIFCTHTLVK